MSNTKLRPIIVKETTDGKMPRKAVFHGFMQESMEVSDAIVLHYAVAMVEYGDGTVESVPAYTIQFTDK